MPVPQSAHMALRLPELRRDREIVGLAGRGDLRHPAAKAIELPSSTGPLPALAARIKKSRKLPSLNQDWTALVDRLEAGLQPRTHCVLV